RLPPEAALARAHRQRAGPHRGRGPGAAGGPAQGVRVGGRAARCEPRGDRRARARAAAPRPPRGRGPSPAGGGGVRAPAAAGPPGGEGAGAQSAAPRAPGGAGVARPAAGEGWPGGLRPGRRLSPRPVDAYGRALTDYVAFPRRHELGDWREATLTFVDGY